jgi:hypothetical protein
MGRTAQKVFMQMIFVGSAMPNDALACAVCFVAKPESLMAYFGTGVLLSVLPLALIGGLAVWLYRQGKLHSEER